MTERQKGKERMGERQYTGKSIREIWRARKIDREWIIMKQRLISTKWETEKVREDKNRE